MARERRHPMGTARRSALCLALLAAIPVGADAAKINYSVGGYVEHSDNIGLTESNPEKAETLGALFDFDLNQTGKNTNVTARGGFEYLYYTGDTFDDDIRATLVGHLDWNTMQDRLQFLIEDYLNYEPIDVLAANAPDNQQQVNVFLAGATLNLRPGAATRTRLDVRYNNYYAEETEEFNGDRYNAAFTLWQDTSATTRMAGTIEASQVEYDQPNLGADYRRLDTYATLNRNLANFDLNLRLGYSWVELLSFDGEQSSPLVRGVLTWRASPRSTINGALYYQFSDAAQELITRSDDIGSPTVVAPPPSDQAANDLLIGPDIYKQRRVEFDYRFSGERYDFAIGPYYENNEYLDPTVESEGSYGLGLGATWRIQPMLHLTCLLSRSYRDFDTFDRDDDDFAAYLSLIKIFTRNWSASIDLRHQERNSNVPEASYDENAAIFSVRYTR
jgi:hypothetical protein